jgi:carbamoylphosphate synthase large subunit
MINWGEIYMLARRLEEALQLAGRAMEFSRVHKERDNQTAALRLLGEIAAQRDPREVVEA